MPCVIGKPSKLCYVSEKLMAMPISKEIYSFAMFQRNLIQMAFYEYWGAYV